MFLVFVFSFFCSLLLGLVLLVFLLSLFTPARRRFFSPVQSLHGSATRVLAGDTKHVVVVGGGVAGLSAAYALMKRHDTGAKNALKITLLEKSNRLGGSLWSQKIRAVSPELADEFPLHANAYLEVENGPRSMRSVGPSALQTLALLESLGLASKLRLPNAKMASCRFVLTRNESDAQSPTIVATPTTLWSALQFAARFGLFLPLLTKQIFILPMQFVTRQLAALLTNMEEEEEADDFDESVEEFFATIVGEKAASIFGSAMMHGVFGGDSRTLSMRCCLPRVARLQHEYGSVLFGALLDAPVTALRALLGTQTPFYCCKTHTAGTAKCHWGLCCAPDVASLSVDAQRAVGARLFSLHGGAQQLVDELSRQLEMSPHITIRRLANVVAFRSNGSGGASVLLQSHEAIHCDHVICAMPPTALASLTKPSFAPLANVDSVTITCVSIIFAGSSPNQVLGCKYTGFGMLSSRDSSDFSPSLLGIIFDSCIFDEQSDEKESTVVTIMFRGGELLHDVVLQGKAVHALTSVLKVDSNQISNVNVVRWKDAIPQFDLKYWKIMNEMKKQVSSFPWLSLCGKAFGDGVGVPDCIVSGLNAAKRIKVE